MAYKPHRPKAKKSHDDLTLKPGSMFSPHGLFALAIGILLMAGFLGFNSASTASTPDPVPTSSESPSFLSKQMALSQTLLALAQAPQPARVWTNYVGDEACFMPSRQGQFLPPDGPLPHLQLADERFDPRQFQQGFQYP